MPALERQAMARDDKVNQEVFTRVRMEAIRDVSHHFINLDRSSTSFHRVNVVWTCISDAKFLQCSSQFFETFPAFFVQI